MKIQKSFHLLSVIFFALALIGSACAKEPPSTEVSIIDASSSVSVEPVKTIAKSGIDNEYDIQKEVLQIETNSATEVAVKAVLSAQVQTNEPASVPASRQGEFVEVNTADNDVPPKATPVIEELSPAQEMLNLAQYRGKVVYLDFWASWCVPCQSTFPWMDAMQKKYPDDIVFVAVNFGENPEDTQEFLKRFPADIKFIYDPLVQIASEYGVPGLPYSFVYGRKGELLGKHAGFSGGSEINLEAALQNLFATGE